MQLYINNVYAALAFFPVVAAVFTAPYALGQYRRYGGMPMVRVLIVYSMVLYLLCAYFMVILPLPTRAEVLAAAPVYPQLHPLNFVGDFFRDSGFVAGSPATYLAALKSHAFLVVFFNVLLTVPFGMYLGYYFRRGWKAALALCFALALFFELTQLSGLYFIYPRPYRMFDVDDLLLNTLGGMIGFWLSPLAGKILPSRERLDALSYRKGRRVSLTRRITAAGVDWLCIGTLYLGTVLAGSFAGMAFVENTTALQFAGVYVATVFLVFCLLPRLTGGRTLGKALVGIRLRRKEGGAPALWQYTLRYGLLYCVILPSPIWSLFVGNGTMNLLTLGLTVTAFLVFFLFIWRFFATGLTKENHFFYERVSGLVHESSVKEPAPEKAAEA